jgi:hypothetical protein
MSKIYEKMMSKVSHGDPIFVSVMVSDVHKYKNDQSIPLQIKVVLEKIIGDIWSIFRIRIKKTKKGRFTETCQKLFQLRENK